MRNYTYEEVNWFETALWSNQVEGMVVVLVAAAVAVGVSWFLNR